MSRFKKSAKNARISIAFMLLVLFLTFFSRKIFIESLGTEIVGLTSTLQNILGFLNLAELGIVSAIAATLYRPLYEGNQEEINDIVSIYGYLYRLIGIGILVVGVLGSFFLPFIFKNSGLDLVDIFGGYFAFLGSSLIGYFISYRQTLLDADQRQYVIVTITNIANIGKILLQIISLMYLGGNYVHWLIIELIFGSIYGFWINSKVAKFYPWLNTSYTHGKEIRKKYSGLFITIKNVIPHKIGSFVLNQTSSILVYAFSNLSMVTLYTNYTLILSKAVSIITTTFNGVGGSIGHLIAEGDKNNIKRVFWELHFIFFLMASVLIISGYYLVEPFIILWLGDAFILNQSVFYVILFNVFISVIRNPIGLYLNGYLLFKDVWAPIAEAVINLLFAIVLGYCWGVLGVLLGSSISLVIIVMLWKPYFLYKEAFHETVLEYWIEFLKYCVALVLTWFIVSLFVESKYFVPNQSFLLWGRNAFLLVLIIGVLYTFFSLLFCKGGRYVSYRVVNIIKSKNRF